MGLWEGMVVGAGAGREVQDMSVWVLPDSERKTVGAECKWVAESKAVSSGRG